MLVDGALLSDPSVHAWARQHLSEFDNLPLQKLVECARRSLGRSRSAAALTLLSVWRQHREKFAAWPTLAVDRESAEQASGANAASWRAGRFAGCGRILDLCCGVGGDAIALSYRCDEVIAIDRDFGRLLCARHNLEAFGKSDHSFVVCGNVTDALPDAEAAFLDPDRRSRGKRVVRPDLYDPPVGCWEPMRKTVRTLAVKTAPGIAYEDIPGAYVPEFVDDRGECREAVLWSGERAPGARTATVLNAAGTSGAAILDASAPELFRVGGVGAFVYDPSPAVVRAHLITHLAAVLDGWRLDKQIAYLSSDLPVDSPFARRFAVSSVLPFNLKKLKAHLRQRSIGALEIRTRRFPVEPDALRGMLSLKGSGSATLVLTRIDGRATAIVCDNE